VEPQSLLQDFALITGTAAAALFLFRILRQPAILGYLLAGVLISPLTFSQFSVIETGSIQRMADLGLVVLLFALGIEFGWERIRRVGLRVVFIAAVEIVFMVWIGYQIGLALGWSATEAFFLGSALSISSSAVLAKLLRDSGQLSTRRGQLIVGILVIEDFAGVVLLSVLSGLGTTGASDAGDVSLLAGRLAVFAVAALVLGALIAPRLVSLVERLQSTEMLLLASLGMCFGLALMGEWLGLSAAAGAFLIGTVIGDSAHSQIISRLTAPVRDLFGAIFFVSVGMLIDLKDVPDLIVPIVVVTVVFVAGKLLINVVATFLSGEGPRTAVEVGTGMPQMGEFSLAMVRSGTDKGVVGANLSPVIASVTVITSFAAPYLFRSAGAISDLVARRSPVLLRQYLTGLTHALNSARAALGARAAQDEPVRRAARRVMVNAGVIALLFAVGTVALRFSSELTGELHIANTTLGLIVSGVVLFLCVPPALIVFRATGELSDLAAERVIGVWPEGADWLRRRAFARVVRTSIRAVLVVLAALWALPFMLSLFKFGPFVWLIALGIAVLLAVFGFRSARQVHGQLEITFRRTIFGGD
jgi:CPA2 family monovalent cation:H+ antiporter-2